MKESVNGAVKEVTAASVSKSFILWDGATLILVNFPMEVLKELQFVEKKMLMEEVPVNPKNPEGRKRQKVTFKIETAEPYSCFVHPSGVPVIRTLQGYWKRVTTWAVRNGLNFEFRNLCSKDLLPPPRFDLMHGFRFNQREFTETGLSKGYSGMFSACTRYGKSTVIRNIMRAFPDVCTALVAPGETLLKQLFEEVKAAFPDREVKMIGGGSTTKYPTATGINVVSADSLHRLDPADIRLMLVDEPHTIVSEGRLPELMRFELARLYAVGATLDGRYDGRDALLEGLFGPVISRVTYKEALAMGAVCLIKVAMIQIVVPRDIGQRDSMYRKHILQNRDIHRICAMLHQEAIPKEDQALFFIKQEKQAREIQKVMGMDVPIVMAKLLTGKERDNLTAQVADDFLKRVLCSDIFVQGVTFHEIRHLLNSAGGGPSTSALQRPGRLAEIRPDKRFGIMYDFQIVVAPKQPHEKGGDPKAERKKLSGVMAIARESRQRREVYENIGYEVEEVLPENLAAWVAANNTHES